MTQEEFIEKVSLLEQQIAELKEQYVKENSPIPAGTKVKVTTPPNWIGKGYKVEYGIINKYEVRSYNVYPVISKLKKDGTAHPTAYLFTSYNSKVEVCND